MMNVRKQARKGAMLLLAVALAGAGLVTGAPKTGAAGASEASYVGIDKTTRGQWNGVYGQDGYILFGYGATPDPVNTITVDKYAYDAVSKPAYVDEIEGNAYKLNDASQVKVYPGTRDGEGDILDIPAGSGLPNKIESSVQVGSDAPGGGGQRLFTFAMNDDEEHLFTVYSTKDLNWKYFGFRDADDQYTLPLTRGGDLFDNNGAESTYVTFKVKGSFTFEYDNEWESGLQGFFFDPVAGEEEPEAANAGVYLGADTATSGHWNGKYGSDGYALVAFDPGVPRLNQWQEIDASPAIDLRSLPAYVDSYAYAPGSKVVMPPTSDSDQLYDYVVDMPAGEARDKYIAWAKGGNPVVYTFNLNDDEEHVFSFYSKMRYAVGIQLSDLDGEPIAQQAIAQEAFNNGAYVSFLVKGSIRVSIANESADFGASGFFFDAPLAERPGTVTAEALPDRKARIAWTNEGSPDKVIVERRTGSGQFVPLASLSGGATEYTDANLTPGETYSYRLRNAKGTRYGTATDPLSITVATMTPTELTLLDAAPIAVTAGGSVSVAAKFERIEEDGSKTVLADKPVTFKLRGEHVGDGTTLGQEIPAELGTAVTDPEGVASLIFSADYAGEYTVVAATAPDDDSGLDGATSDPVGLTVAPAAFASAPVLLKASDAVAPGKLFSLNGYGLRADTLDIAISFSNGGAASAVPPAQAIHPEIAQTDRNGYFAVARLPANAKAGAYDVWAKNADGWSAPYKLNAARPLFISDYEAYDGIEIDMAGRNFDQAEFGGKSDAKVRLNDGAGRVSSAQVKELNPYGITFNVGNAALGTYFVEVSNDGGKNWSRPSSGQKLTIVPKGKDPLDLGVAWARDFDWNHKVDVTDYGANQKDALNDTAAVQAAVDAAATGNGGVVYFPKGSYYIDTINLPSGVVLLGQDEEDTKLYYTGTSKNFIDTKANDPSYGPHAERQGVAKLSLLLSDPNLRPDSFMWLGEGWGASVSDKSLRTANRLFVVDVRIDYPTAYDRQAGSGRGLGLEFIGKERILVKDNRFVGWHAQPFITFMSEYYTLKNNYFAFTEGFVVGTSTYSFYVNNHVKVVNQEARKETHGLFARSNAYIAGNVIENTGDIANQFNDGEAIALEMPNGVFNYGQVLKADADSITVAPTRDLVKPSLDYGVLSILISDGKGMGQLREVASLDKYKIAVAKPFDIIPDSTSRFTLIAPNDNATIYDNTIRNNAKGIWLFGNSYDGVVSDNKSFDSEGIFLYSVRNTQGMAPGYFTRITRNDVAGISRRSNHGGIGFNTARGDNGRYYSIDVYATEITNNSVSGDNAVQPGGGTEAPPYGGIYAISASHSTQYDGVGSGDSTNTIIDGNKLSDLGTGVNLTRASYGQIVTNNAYDATVTNFLVDTGSENTLAANNFLAPSEPGTAPAKAAWQRPGRR